MATAAPLQFYRPVHTVTVAGLLLVPRRAARKGKGSGYDIMRSF